MAKELEDYHKKVNSGLINGKKAGEEFRGRLPISAFPARSF